MQRIRSFVAIELPNELKTGLAQLQAQLKVGEQPWVKWVDPNSIHLTLKFLGNISISKTGEITKLIEEATQGIPHFHLEVKGLGTFPNFKRPQVAWVGMEGEVDRLVQLQQRLDSNLASLGFAVEKRSFTPHLTLARLRNGTSPEDRQKFGQLIAHTEFEPACTVWVESISLMKSQLTREGAIYSRVSSVELKRHLPTRAT